MKRKKHYLSSKIILNSMNDRILRVVNEFFQNSQMYFILNNYNSRYKENIKLYNKIQQNYKNTNELSSLIDRLQANLNSYVDIDNLWDINKLMKFVSKPSNIGNFTYFKNFDEKMNEIVVMNYDYSYIVFTLVSKNNKNTTITILAVLLPIVIIISILFIVYVLFVRKRVNNTEIDINNELENKRDEKENEIVVNRVELKDNRKEEFKIIDNRLQSDSINTTHGKKLTKISYKDDLSNVQFSYQMRNSKLSKDRNDNIGDIKEYYTVNKVSETDQSQSISGGPKLFDSYISNATMTNDSNISVDDVELKDIKNIDNID